MTASAYLGRWIIADAPPGAVVARHVIDRCTQPTATQPTGSNHAFFTEIPGLEHPGDGTW